MEQWNLWNLPNKTNQKIVAWFSKTEIKLIFCRDTTTERIAQINPYLVNYFEKHSSRLFNDSGCNIY